MVAAFGAIFVGFLQFKEARRDRVEASEALTRATRVEGTVKDLEGEIAEARQQIAELDTIRAAGEQGAAQISEILRYSREVQDQFDTMRGKIEELDERAAISPPKPGLKFAKVTSHPTGDGLEAILRFESIGSIALSQLSFTVRIIEPSDVRILDISPAVPVSMMVGTQIQPGGTAAHLKYTTLGDSNAAVSLRVSGPALLEVQGSPGLEPFRIRVE